MDRHSASPCETPAERYQALLEVAEAISAHRDLHELFRDLAQRLPAWCTSISSPCHCTIPVRNTMRLHTIRANVPADLVGGHEGPVEESPAGLVSANSSRSSFPILPKNVAGRRSLNS